MDYQHLQIERIGPVGVLWLNRPQKLNAMSVDIWEDIPKAMAELDEDEEVRVIVLAGRGRAFTVGIDVGLLAGLRPEGQSLPDKTERMYEKIRHFQKTIDVFAESPKPTIAAIQGYCLGAGISLATACDIRLATEDAVLSIRETRMGLTADVGVLQRLPGIVGSGHTAELAFTGKDVDATRAKEIGLVNHLYPDTESLMDAAMSLADDIASNSPLVLTGVKRTLAANRDLTLDQALEYVARNNSTALFANDLEEAVTAFLEDRPPDFKGN